MKLRGHASERTSKIKEENDHMARYIGRLNCEKISIDNITF
jgi:hypothetical protein